MFPDGSIATRTSGTKDWSTVKQSGDQRHSVESNHEGDIKISREDFVTFSKTKSGHSSAEFECSTVIQTQIGENVHVFTPNFANVLFDHTGKQEIKISDCFKVERSYKDGFTTSIRVTRVFSSAIDHRMIFFLKWALQEKLQYN